MGLEGTNRSSGPLLTELQMAERLGISVATVRKRRLFRRSPSWIKIGASVRYRPEEVENLIANSTFRVEDTAASGSVEQCE